MATSAIIALELRRPDGSAVDGASVLVSDPDGAQVGSLAATDVDGKASIEVPFGGRLSAFVEDGGNYAYSAAVTPSTTKLVVVHAPEIPNTHSPVNVSFSVNCPMCAAGHKIRWSLPCANAETTTTGPGTVTGSKMNYVGCPGQEALQVYAVWYDDTDAVRGMATMGPISFGTTDMTFPTSIATTTAKTLDISVSPIGAASAIYLLYATVPTGRGFERLSSGGGLDSIQLAAPSVPNLTLSCLVTDADPTYRIFHRRFDPFNGGSVDFDGQIARPTTPASYDGTEASFAFGTGDLGDAIQVHAVSAGAEWLLVEPAAATGSIRLPALPASLAAFDLDVAATLTQDNVDATTSADYEAFLASGVAVVPSNGGDGTGVRWSTDAD
jgi:hypothetical protein